MHYLQLLLHHEGNFTILWVEILWHYIVSHSLKFSSHYIGYVRDRESLYFSVEAMAHWQLQIQYCQRVFLEITNVKRPDEMKVDPLKSWMVRWKNTYVLENNIWGKLARGLVLFNRPTASVSETPNFNGKLRKWI